MGFKSKPQTQRPQPSPSAAVDVAGEGGSGAGPAPRSTKMRTTRCHNNSLDRPGSGDDPTSASRREHRDAALTAGSALGSGAGPGPTWAGMWCPQPGSALLLEGHPPKPWGVRGAGDGAGTGVMEWAVPLASCGLLQTPTLSIRSEYLKCYRLSPFKLLIVAFGCVSEGDSAELQCSQVAELPYQGRGWGCPTPSHAPAAIPAPLWEGTGTTKPLFPAESKWQRSPGHG